jgi:hypothetical protein
MKLVVAAALVLSALGAPAPAHEVRPGYLELRESGAERFELMWKVPARGDRRYGLRPVLPDECSAGAEPRALWTDEAYVERSTIVCRGGLDGRTITIDGLRATMTDVLVRVARANGTIQVVRLTPASPAFVVDAAAGPVHVALTYLGLGVEHILLGVDHLLFVLALVLVVGPTRRLVGTVTAFTVAHSLTLGAATLGFVHVPQTPVEAVIALSIAFVAAEIVHGRAGAPGLTARSPWLVAFAFGLLHGLGFAGALAELGLPPQAIPLALLFFNVGVEIGQLAFIAGVLGVLALVRRIALPVPAWSWRVPAYAIGSLAAYWTITRLAVF